MNSCRWSHSGQLSRQPLFAVSRYTRLMLEIHESIGWNLGEAQVFRAIWHGQPAVLKRHRQLHKFVRERHDSQVWAHTGYLPEVLHHDEANLELVFAWAPGECAAKVAPTEQMYWVAGHALRTLHDAAPRPLPFDDGRGDVADLMARYLPRAAGVLPARQVQRVEVLTRDLLGHPFPPTVLRHADYSARNWLWDGERLTVIDTEMARPGPAVLDVVKLWNQLSTTTDAARLSEAFQQGYGRAWTAGESEFLGAVRALDALVMVVWCHEHEEAAGKERFRSALNQLCPV